MTGVATTSASMRSSGSACSRYGRASRKRRRKVTTISQVPRKAADKHDAACQVSVKLRLLHALMMPGTAP
jgi:hypothetical protein